jgi:hypothetical protein
MDRHLRPAGALMAAVILLAPILAADGPDAELPDDFRQLIPRGRIASVDNPTFVPASEAEISDDAWVLGVEIDGEAKAYSLNLLNHHEIINDRFGETPVAAVW